MRQVRGQCCPFGVSPAAGWEGSRVCCWLPVGIVSALLAALSVAELSCVSSLNWFLLSAAVFAFSLWGTQAYPVSLPAPETWGWAPHGPLPAVERYYYITFPTCTCLFPLYVWPQHLWPWPFYGTLEMGKGVSSNGFWAAWGLPQTCFSPYLVLAPYLYSHTYFDFIFIFKSESLDSVLPLSFFLHVSIQF